MVLPCSDGRKDIHESETLREIQDAYAVHMMYYQEKAGFTFEEFYIAYSMFREIPSEVIAKKLGFSKSTVEILAGKLYAREDIRDIRFTIPVKMPWVEFYWVGPIEPLF